MLETLPVPTLEWFPCRNKIFGPPLAFGGGRADFAGLDERFKKDRYDLAIKLREAISFRTMPCPA
jgi:hypothetical protein